MNIETYREASPVGRYILELEQNPLVCRQIAHHRLEEGSPAEYGECVLPWNAACKRILAERNIQLYSHQAKAMDYIRAGKSVMISTPTASGKSLIYNLPFHESYARDQDVKALYLFPLKALAQDQLGAFQALSQSWPREARPIAALYDGDCKEGQRRKLRKNPPAVLMTNPEMLNLSFLAYHESWSTFLANLAYIVVDEAHCYRGLFGSHMAQLFRRLNRICRHYGTEPVYIFCSATLGNPLELARDLGGKDDVRLIEHSGAPRARRHFIFMDPELSSSTCAIDLLKRALEKDLRTIVYCQSRRMTELISMWAGTDAAEWKNRISAYRAGFLPEERREIEERMSSGDLRAVVSTSALELGIDIGGLDLCILAGYPGTVMQTRQRGGRVGRAGRESAIIVVAGDDALDQYFIRNPEDFFQRPPEKAVINPDNAFILDRHLECAAAELPLQGGEEWLQRPAVQDAVKRLAERGLLARSKAGEEWLATHKRPQSRIDLRGSGQSYSIEEREGKLIGAIDSYRAWRECHPGAVYIHKGRHYLVESLDDGRQRIVTKEAHVDWHTRVRTNKSTEIIELLEAVELGACALIRCRLKITEKITSYEKRSNSGKRLLGIVPLEAPAHVFETEGICFVIPDWIRKRLEDNFIHFMGSIHAMEHAIIGLLPLEVMADRDDFGGISTPMHPQLGLAGVFIYDSMPGGAGLTRAAFQGGKRILESTYRAIAACACEDGCPSCIQSPKCGAGNRPLSKAGVLLLLEAILKGGHEGEPCRPSLEISPPIEESPKTLMEPEPLALPHYVVFDVETRLSAQEVGGWNNAHLMGVSIAVLYDSREDQYFTYTQDELEDMFTKMSAAELVIGFNNLRFDNKVLLPFWEKWPQAGKKDIYSLPSLDMLKYARGKLAYPISLDNLAKATLGCSKSADGLQALRWWQEGRLEKIAEYCRKDVEISRDIYLYGLGHGCLFFTNKAGMRSRLEVDFSRPNNNY